MSMKFQKARVTRSPSGLLSSKPVYMRLTSKERSILEELAHAEHRSISSVARFIFLAGVQPYQAELNRKASDRGLIEQI